MRFARKENNYQVSTMSAEALAEHIYKLKERARKHYEKYYSMIDSKDASCGRNLLEHMCAGIGVEKDAFNKIMDELALIDPTTPKQRL